MDRFRQIRDSRIALGFQSRITHSFEGDCLLHRPGHLWGFYASCLLFFTLTFRRLGAFISGPSRGSTFIKCRHLEPPRIRTDSNKRHASPSLPTAAARSICTHIHMILTFSASNNFKWLLLRKETPTLYWNCMEMRNLFFFLCERLYCEINEALQRICHLLPSSPIESFPTIITTINLSETPLNQLLI